jgi:catechol 2,3-dioxygenase-like lactoylglutathione lyase family enzyme
MRANPANRAVILTLEVVTLPVTDVDRARAFYTEQASFTLDVDYQPTPEFRVVQLTPLGSACSAQLVAADSPSRVCQLYLVTTDLAAERVRLIARGVAVGPARHKEPVDTWAGGWSAGLDPQRRDYASFADLKHSYALSVGARRRAPAGYGLDIRLSHIHRPHTVARAVRGRGHPRRHEHMVAWDRVARSDVLRAIQEYERLGAEQFLSEHGFGPTTTYELVWDKHAYPPKAILGAAYKFATGQPLRSGDFEGGKSGAVRVLEKLGFVIQKK